MRVAGFKLAAGNQQGGVGAQLGLDPGARVWVQRDLLLSRGDLLHRTAHVLHRKQEKETSCVSFRLASCRKPAEEIHDTHLPLLVADFDQEHLQRHRVLLVLAVLREFSCKQTTKDFLLVTVRSVETIKQSADMEKRTSFMEEASKGELKIGGQAVEEGKTF